MKYKNIKIRKSGNGVSWFARFRKNNKQLYVSAKTQLGCYAKVKELYNKTNDQQNNISIEYDSTSEITFLEWYNQWLITYKQNIRPATISCYKTMLKYTKEINNIKLNEINNLKIQNMLNNVKSERQRQKVYEFVNQILNKAYNNELIKKNPVKSIEKPKHKRETVIPLSTHDEKKFIEYCTEINDDLHLLMLYQGLRPGEAIAINVEDINFENKTLNINKSLDFRNKIGETKNEYSKRIIPLKDKTINVLLKYKDKTGRIFKFANDKAVKLFREIRTILNLNPKYKQKSLRSTFITKCMEENIPVHIIQSWVGHVEGSKVTTETYTKTRNDKALFYFNKINN